MAVQKLWPSRWYCSFRTVLRVVERRARVGVVGRGGAQGVADQGGHGGRARRPCRTRRPGRAPTGSPRAGTGRRSRRRPRRGGDVVVGGGVQAGHLRQRMRQQAALQGGDQLPQPLALAARLPGGRAAVRARRRGGRGRRRSWCGSAAAPRPGSFLTAEVTRTGSRSPSAARRSRATPPTSPCMLSSGREVGLVVDPPADGQQVGEPAPPDQVVAGVAEPAQQRRVDLGDLPVQAGWTGSRRARSRTGPRRCPPAAPEQGRCCRPPSGRWPGRARRLLTGPDRRRRRRSRRAWPPGRSAAGSARWRAA